MNRPANNRVVIDIISASSASGTNYAPVPTGYTLSLSFELQE